jgi:NAD(P)-dependent dehydrogenase (short-subunit alcohol dehydrogenase family)
MSLPGAKACEGHLKVNEVDLAHVNEIANENSIAWGCAKAFRALGAELAVTYLRKLDFAVHSIAFSPKEALQGRGVDVTQEGFLTTMDVSCWTFIRMAHLAEPLMKKGETLFTMTYYGSQMVVKNYNIMGVAKSTLESAVRCLAAELGPKGIRVHAISPGPLATRLLREFLNSTRCWTRQRQRARACLSKPQDRRYRGPAHSSSPFRPRARPRVAVHARLLCRVAHAQVFTPILFDDHDKAAAEAAAPPSSSESDELLGGNARSKITDAVPSDTLAVWETCDTAGGEEFAETGNVKETLDANTEQGFYLTHEAIGGPAIMSWRIFLRLWLHLCIRNSPRGVKYSPTDER